MNSSRLRPGLVSGWLSILLMLLAAGCGGASSSKTLDAFRIEVGNAGRVQIGRWTPIVVSSTAPVAEKIHPEVIAPDPDGLPVRFVLPELADGASRGEFLVGQVESPIRVEFRSSDGKDSLLKVVTLTTRNSDLQFLKPDVRLWGVFEQDSFLKESLGKFVQELSVPDKTGGAVHSPIDIRPLTGEARLDGIDTIFLTAKTFRGLPGGIGERLRTWVGAGGHLIVLAQGAPEDYAAPGFGEWYPIQIDSAGGLRFRDLVILSKGVNRGLLRTPREGVPGVRMTAPTGRALLSSLDGDLLVRAPWGRGGVTMLAIDIEGAPLVDWDGLPPFLGGLADFIRTQEVANKHKTDLNPTGISDLQTQLLRTTNDFPEIRRPSYWGSLGLILLAFLVVGPIDYVIVHHLLKRPHWTWFTLVAWIALLTFTGVAYARHVTGEAELANQLDLLDVDETLGRVGARTWYTLYGPESRRIDLSIAPGPEIPVKSVAMSEIRWSGRPEAGFRGMHRPGGLNLGEPGYTIEPRSGDAAPRLVGYPLRPGSTCDIEGEWEGTLARPLVESALQGDMKSRFQGTFTCNLPGKVTDWFIAYGMFAFYAPLEARGYPIMTLKPDMTVNVRELQSRRLEDFLSGVVTTARFRQDKKSDDYTFTRAPYDPVGVDPYSIFKVVSFYRSSGGQGYVQLTNGPVQSLDRSSVVQNGHAVLFGRLEVPASTVSVENARPTAAAQSFVRVVLPVRQIATDYSFPKLDK